MEGVEEMNTYYFLVALLATTTLVAPCVYIVGNLQHGHSLKETLYETWEDSPALIVYLDIMQFIAFMVYTTFLVSNEV